MTDGHTQGIKPHVLILGAGGMLGNALFRVFLADSNYETFGTLRSKAKLSHFAPQLRNRLQTDVDIEKDRGVLALFADVRPDIVINCIGIIKQHSAATNHLITLSINSILPHRLAQFCGLANARLIHLSTDCVFSGAKGLYTERDFPDAGDLYGRTKLLGEVDYPHAITLRTSIIGHELGSSNSLIEWLLSQEGSVSGYRKAVFSGLPTVEIARVIRDFVLPHAKLHGLYHLSAEPIDKFELLSMVAGVYGKTIEIRPSDRVVIDRSLVSDRFREATGFRPPSWKEMIDRMHEHQQSKWSGDD